MKYVKENLTLVICGAVIILALVFAFVPGVPYMAPALQDAVRADLSKRFSSRETIRMMGNTKLELPNHEDGKGVPTEAWIKAKTESIASVQVARTLVETLARQGNMANRFDGKSPLLPVPNASDRTRMTFEAMPGCLPAAQPAARQAFKDHITEAYSRWTGLLAKGAGDLANTKAAVPPTAEEIKAEYARLHPPVSGGMGGMAAQDAELVKYQKQALIECASGLHMYVEATAFQKRAWYVGNDPPSDQEIFTGFVDTWCQSDVVTAILNVNNEALKSVSNSNQRNVGASPVKRLTRIVVGANARARQTGTAQPSGGAGVGVTAAAGADPGPVFFTATNTNAAGGGASPRTAVPVNRGGGGPPVAPEDQPGPANEIRHELGMTGRSAGADYDVVPMSVVMDIDPSYLNRFIELLYRQNMSYTVTNIQWRTVDPLDRASNGYLYGFVQVIEVEVQIEGLFLRSWTQPLMPKDIKQTLGIAPKA